MLIKEQENVEKLVLMNPCSRAGTPEGGVAIVAETVAEARRHKDLKPGCHLYVEVARSLSGDVLKTGNGHDTTSARKRRKRGTSQHEVIARVHIDRGHKGESVFAHLQEACGVRGLALSFKAIGGNYHREARLQPLSAAWTIVSAEAQKLLGTTIAASNGKRKTASWQ